MNDSIIGALTGFIPQLLPEVVLALTACALFIGGTWRGSRHLFGALALASLALAAVALFWTAQNIPTLEARVAEASGLQGDELTSARQAATATVYAAPVLHTRLSLFFKILGLVTGAVLVLLGWDDAGDEHPGEYHACLLLIVAGICFTGAANDLITLFVALELISIPTYVLLYLPRADALAQESAMKYFLLSIFSSALLLFGFSYLYGLTGTTNISALLDTMTLGRTGPWQPMALLAVIMVVAGLGFKITAVPFHFYAPDVYQGTTTPAAALLAFVPKIVGFAALLRILGYTSVTGLLTGTPDTMAGRALSDQVPMLLWIMSAVTMTLGNILALLQDNVKRMLAYSSVAHAGYMLIGMAVVPYIASSADGLAGGELVGGVEALLFYLIAYGCMTVGAFAVLHAVSTPERPAEKVDDLAGLSKTHPGLALLMVLFLFSLIGIPLTAGFAGKFLLFYDAIGANEKMQIADQPSGLALGGFTLLRFNMTPALLCRVLGLIAAVNAAIGAYYYLRMAMAMYFRDGIEPLPRPKEAPVLVTIGVCAVLTLALGVYPEGLMKGIRYVMPHKAPAGAAVAPAPERAVAER